MPTEVSYGAGVSSGFPRCKFRVTGTYAAAIRDPRSGVRLVPVRYRSAQTPVARRFRAASRRHRLAGNVGLGEEGADLPAQFILDDVDLSLRIQDAESELIRHRG